MKMNFYKNCFALLLMGFTLMGCGGKKELPNGKILFEETQQWTKYEVGKSFSLDLSSYNSYEINGKPIAMMIDVTPESEDSEFTTIAFVLYDAESGEPLKDVSFDKNITQIYMNLDYIDDELEVDVIPIEGKGFKVVMRPSSIESASSDANIVLAGLAKSNETSLTAQLMDGNNYTWNFHTYMDLTGNKDE